MFAQWLKERDYALEMWRLLDPHSKLIIMEELLDRIVCVKSHEYIPNLNSDSGSMHGDEIANRFFNPNENGYSKYTNSFGYLSPKEEFPTFSNAPEPSRVLDPRIDGSKKLIGPVSALKELCMVEGLGLTFQSQPQFSGNMDEVYAQVEIDGQVFGKGVGLTWDEAKKQAADKALGGSRSMLGHFHHKRQGSPRPFQGLPNKRFRPEFPRGLQRMPSSGRYPRNASPVPPETYT